MEGWLTAVCLKLPTCAWAPTPHACLLLHRHYTAALRAAAQHPLHRVCHRRCARRGREDAGLRPLLRLEQGFRCCLCYLQVHQRRDGLQTTNRVLRAAQGAAVVAAFATCTHTPIHQQRPVHALTALQRLPLQLATTQQLLHAAPTNPPPLRPCARAHRFVRFLVQLALSEPLLELRLYPLHDISLGEMRPRRGLLRCLLVGMLRSPLLLLLLLWQLGGGGRWGGGGAGG